MLECTFLPFKSYVIFITLIQELKTTLCDVNTLLKKIFIIINSPNRAGYPQEVTAEATGMAQGQFRWRQFHEMVATVWQDTKTVNFLSLVHPATEPVEVAHNRRKREGGYTVQQ